MLRCIELRFTDYLTKPFIAASLKVRIDATPAAQRGRHAEPEYWEQVGQVVDAAGEVQAAALQTQQPGRG